MPFKKIDPKMNFPKLEEEILKFWEEQKIFEKSVAKKSPAGDFIFYEGPPSANGRPGLHHVIARAFKDIIPRYKTMKGYRVARKAGWDTHGLPVELQVEKALGLKNKQDIENIVPGNPRASIIEFNKKCKESVWQYKEEWEKMTRRMGYWVDMKNPYITYENKYIESVWWILAQIFKTKNKDGESLIYRDHKVVPYCYRCGTALSSHEVAQGYQKIKENSVYLKFKLKPNKEKGIDNNTFILVWTTTPWTLPGNVALAINEEIDYVIYEDNRDAKGNIETYIVSLDYYLEKFPPKEILEGRPSEFPHEKGRIIGKDLLNLKYEPFYKLTDDKNTYKIIHGDFILTTDGTGIVHIAPAFGEDDADAGKENDLPTLITVNEKGEITADVPGKGIPVKKKDDKGKYKADELIISDLKKRNIIFKEEMHEHDYPFCWRCETPLIYYAKPSWFIRMSELADDLAKNNENINWIPEYIKEGRFGEWLRGVKDWAISRERYWGTPLPIWTCECGENNIVESIKELEKLSGKKLEDLHKPFIDDIKIKCQCGKKMQRVPEVLDVWFDSGSMPLAQYFYPNGATAEDKKNIDSGKFLPADYISEAIDQTRGWFYTLHAIATLLNKAGKVPVGYAYKNVICLAHILDAKGKKMSKSKGNVIEPMEVMNQYGADMLRWVLYTINQPGMAKKFDLKVMKDAMNRVFRMLWNSYSFFVMYANIDKFKVQSASRRTKFKSDNLLDKWIISELNILIKNVDEKLDSYDVYAAGGMIEKFIDNLSNWYIRRSRKRFWKSEDDADKNNAYQTLWTVLVELSKLMAPFTPFIAEEIYRNLTSPQPSPSKGEGDLVSVHLADFPKADKKLIDEKLNEEMQKTREIITEALQLRAKAGVKVRQPLADLRIKNYELRKEFLDIIKEELNVKDVKTDVKISENISLNTEITQDLKLEGTAREIIRFIQEMRKEAGFEVDNRIIVGYAGQSEVFAKFGDLIAKEVLANEIKKEKLKEFDLEKEFKEEPIAIQIKK
ncbi:MAG: isoleucine--tRNA ligase [Candidatus Moranbacteria bacterium]|nr:isoleucine--tRNA ligase [Candidatus Moranbacteria bacterium]